MEGIGSSLPRHHLPARSVKSVPSVATGPGCLVTLLLNLFAVPSLGACSARPNNGIRLIIPSAKFQTIIGSFSPRRSPSACWLCASAFETLRLDPPILDWRFTSSALKYLMHSFATQVSNFCRATSARISSFLSRLEAISTRMNRRTIFMSRSSVTGHAHLLQRPIRHPRQRLLIRLLRFRRSGPGQRPEAHLSRPPSDHFISLPACSVSCFILLPPHFALCPALMVPPHAALAHPQPEHLPGTPPTRLDTSTPCRTAIYPPSPAALTAARATSSRSWASSSLLGRHNLISLALSIRFLIIILVLERFKKYCSHSAEDKRGSGPFGLSLRFGSVTGHCGHAPSPKLRQNPKSLAPNGHSIS